MYCNILLIIYIIMHVFIMGIREKISFHFNNKNINDNTNDTNDTVSTIIMRLQVLLFIIFLFFLGSISLVTTTLPSHMPRYVLASLNNIFM